MVGGPRAAPLGWTWTWTLPHAGVGAPRHPCRRLSEGRLAGARGACGDEGALSESQQGATCRARGPRTGRCRGKGLLGGQEWGWVGSGWTCEHGGDHRRRGGRVPKQDPSLHSPLDGKKVPGVASLTPPPHVHRLGDTRAGRNRPAAPGEAVGQARLGPEPPTSPAGRCPASPLSGGRAGGARVGQGTAMWGRHCQWPGTRCAGPQAGWARD